MKPVRQSSLDALREKMRTMATTQNVIKDSQAYYQVATDQNGNGGAILRFLPALPDEEYPFVQIFNHAFQGTNGKWYIETCPTTLKLDCPVCEENNLLFNSGDDQQKKTASIRKRKMYYVSNILVVKDPKESSNEGKVLLYKFGMKIMDKIADMLAPQFKDDEAVDPFDAEEGHNFRLRVTRQGNFPDYDKSSFDGPSSIGDPAKIQSVLNRCQSLQNIIGPHQFKPYDDLKSKFDQIVGGRP